ncbi:MAG: MATE family efflux transporter [Candidatus Acetothermia bacterium]
MASGNGRVEQLKQDILDGPIIKTLFILGWPVMLSNAFQIFYNLVDTYWLGKIGKEAVAAPTMGFPIVFLLISVGFGFSIAGVSLVSQHTGAGHSKDADKAAGQVISFMFTVSIFIAAIGYLTSKPLLGQVMQAPPSVLPLATTYIKIIFAGLPFMFVFFAFRALTRGIGDMVTPMIVTGASVLLNVVLDPILIFGWGGLPELGVAGAAIATVVSRGLASVIALYLLFSRALGIELEWGYLKLKLRWMKQIVTIGGPSSVGQAGTAVGAIVLMSLISQLGVVAVSAYGIGQRIIMLMNVLIWGLASPLTTMIGQNIGAEQVKRATSIAKRAFVALFGMLLMTGTGLFFLREPVFRLFIDEPEVVKEGTRFLKLFVWSVPFFGIFALVSSVFRGSGHTRPPMMLALIRLLGFRVGISYLLAFGIVGIGLGTDGIWYGLSLSNLLGGLLALLWLSTGSWKEKTITKIGKRAKKVKETVPL